MKYKHLLFEPIEIDFEDFDDNLDLEDIKIEKNKKKLYIAS